jgi:response regulator of citrate/malate metabolism
MIESLFRPKNGKNDDLNNSIQRLDAQYARLSMEFEKLRDLERKIDKLDSKLREVKGMMESRPAILPTNVRSSKTKTAIKIILKKYGELSSVQLARLIKLSRTRCNEYLKEMERDGELVAKVDSRKKLYKIRQ